jgi:O-antigen ligase
VAWNLARDNPLTGAGFNFEYGNIRDRWLAYGSEEYEWALRRAQAAHSIYFQVLGQHGFVALGLFLALLVGTWVSLGRLRSRASAHPELGWLSSYASGLQIGLVGYMVTGAFLSSAYFDLAYLYYAFAAILWRDLRTAEERGRTAPPDLRSARSAFELRPSRQPRYGSAKSPDAWAIDKIRRFARPLLTLKRVRHGQDA